MGKKRSSPNSSSKELPAPEEDFTKVEKRKEKKRRKLEEKADAATAKFDFLVGGFQGNRHIKITDVRDSILHVLNHASPPNWIQVQEHKSIKRTVCLFIPGLTPSSLGLHPELHQDHASNMPFPLKTALPSDSSLPVLQKLFSHYCPTTAPGDKTHLHSVMQAFATVHLDDKQKARRDEERRAAAQASTIKNPAFWMLRPDQMHDQAYPNPSYAFSCSELQNVASSDATAESSAKKFKKWQKEDGWIETPALSSTEKVKLKTFGVDCEMVVTKAGKELARVSVVDIDSKPVYDSFVKPDNEILDYSTQWSGITEAKLEGVTTTLLDVQKKLAEIIDSSTILVGHSLECDLQVLKIRHPWVIDTSVLYQHPRGPPFKPSLKWLAMKWLQKEIQNDAGGHNSEEDARTAIELLRKKMDKGHGFGEFVNDNESIFERLARPPHPKLTAVVDHGTPAQWHGAKASKAVACTTDDEVLKGLLECVPDYDFTFGRFMELSHILEWSQPSNAAQGRTTSAHQLPAIDNPPALVSPPEEAESAAFAKLDAKITELYKALPRNTALVIFSGHSDPRELTRLSQKKAKYDKLFKTVKIMKIPLEERWLEEDERRLENEAVKVRKGMVFYCIKR